MALIFVALSRSAKQILNGGAEFIRRCFDEVDMELLGFDGACWILQNFSTLQAADGGAFCRRCRSKTRVFPIFEFSTDQCD